MDRVDKQAPKRKDLMEKLSLDLTKESAVSYLDILTQHQHEEGCSFCNRWSCRTHSSSQGTPWCAAWGAPQRQTKKNTVEVLHMSVSHFPLATITPSVRTVCYAEVSYNFLKLCTHHYFIVICLYELLFNNGKSVAKMHKNNHFWWIIKGLFWSPFLTFHI